ncbi:CapA family protein [Mesorhizobium sp. M4A.F.Ca.ET.020.02.1.1]|uniref:CapA family protein n=2 Tax=Mesorhizobium TaxID=68287 RepID=UPI000FD4BBAD|nr:MULTISPECIES: CapA family protein [unclassified Mesorhizobium]RVD38893.1 CapA family protein [Mesorhizobium sp. M4A.F.Ca.ET.020.02.1.1]RWD40813.1 MAG: CapA family protein [Mesorhizobium sp.]TIU65032.1 MAG: CapA family protein [Mesorhizobium sp.]
MTQDEKFDYVGSTATNVADGFTMVAVGDLMMRRPVTTNQRNGLGQIVERLRNADVTFGNLETNIFDIRAFKGSPQAEHGGSYHVGPPELGPELKTMGFNALSLANNHILDWGLEGMRETGRVLDQNGIIYAGVGENLAHAGAARYLETARGRVALVSFAATFTPMSRAGDPAGEAPGRPGLAALRLANSIVVKPEMLACLKRIRNELPDPLYGEEEDQVVLAGTTFKTGDIVGYSFEPNPQDVDDILRNVRGGKQYADFLIVSNHGHEPGEWSQEPPDYEQSLARRLIDAGADAYVGHGPHRLRGIEIYKGRPIFYSLGHFVFDNLQSVQGADYFAQYRKDPRVDTVAELLAESMKDWPRVDALEKEPPSKEVFYESIFTISRFEQNQLAELRLFPVVLGYPERLANRGVPRLAPRPEAEAILERLRRLSEPFGTHITIEDGVGIIRVSDSSPR